MLTRFFRNTRKPEKTWGGRLMLRLMNRGHQPMAAWGLRSLSPAADAVGLDVGCGGGRNIDTLLKRCAFVHGLDLSEQSVATARATNARAIQAGRADIRQGDVSALPYADASLDFVTAFETVYFWPDIEACFREVNRVLRPGGTFLICNEVNDPVRAARWVAMLDMQVYPAEALETLLQTAGFTAVASRRHPNGKWICVTGGKPA